MNRRAFALFIALVLLASVSCAAPVNLTISIEGGANYTVNESVMLSLGADNTGGSTNCTYANTVPSWSEPEPYSTTAQWNLSGSDGLKTVYYRCTNDGENWSETASDQVILDTQAPSISSLEPDNQSVATSLNPTISADLTDSGSGIDEGSIEMKFNGSVVNATYSSGTLSYSPETNLSESNYSVEVSVTDNAGHQSIAGWNFTVDLPPKIDYTDPEDDDYIKSTSFTISAGISDSGSGINTSATVMKVDGSEVETTFHNGEVEYEADLDEGTIDVELTVYDKSGNSAEESWSFIIDFTEPEVTLLSPSDKSTVSSLYSISAKLSDEYSGIDEDSIVFKVDNVDITSYASYSKGYLAYPAGGIGGGNHSAEIWADDLAGNDAFIYWTFNVVSTVPTIDQLKPESGTNDATPTISARIRDSGSSGLNLGSLRLYLDGADVSSKADYDDSSGIVSYTPSSELSEGSHTAKVEVSDKNGNRGSESWTFTIDKSAPPSPTNLTIRVSGSIAILNWSKVSGASKYNVYRSSTKFTSVSGMSPRSSMGSSTYTDSGAGGRQYYAVTALDSSGNEGAPAFAGTCAIFQAGSWKDYDCCSDSECPFGNCNMSTHTCYTTKADTSKSDAESAIDAAQAAIDAANQSGANVTDAWTLLDSAQSAFRVGNYAQAKNYANQAASSLPAVESNKTGNSEPETGDGKKPLPCCATGFILLGIVSAGLYHKSRV